MELRVLTLEKRGDNYWVYEAHPAAPDKKTITHTSEHTIANMRTYNRFQEVNNTVARYAHELGLDLSQEYPEFFKLGFRVSQQLEGKVKDYTLVRYNEAEWYLQWELKKGIARHYALKANDELEKIVSQELMKSVPAEDQAAIAGYVDRLQRVHFPIDRTGTFLFPLLPGEESSSERSFEAMISMLVYDLKTMVSPASERYAQVPPEARAEFLALCRYQDLFKKGFRSDWFEDDGSQEKLIGLIKETDGVSARKFFKALRLELAREEDFDDFFRMIGYYLDPAESKSGLYITSDQQPLFFELMLKAQEQNIPDWRESIAGEAARLLGAYSEADVRDIVAQAFKITIKGESPFDFLKGKAEERKIA